MKKVVYNTGNLETKEIDDYVKKARAFLVNDNDEVLLVRYANMYMLPGGSVEEGQETFLEGLKRELLEETGISNYTVSEEPFLVIQDYIRDYPKRDNAGTTNRYTETEFFLLHTSQGIDSSQIHLTESEQKRGFQAKFVPVELLSTLIQMTPSNNPKNKYFVRELETVLDNLPDELLEKVKKKK